MSSGNPHIKPAKAETAISKYSNNFISISLNVMNYSEIHVLITILF
jgi:hypothetical protein